MNKHVKSLAIVLLVEAMFCALPSRGLTAADISRVRAIADAIKHDLHENPAPSFARGRGPIDLDYKLHVSLSELCAMDIRALEASVIADRIKDENLDPMLQDVSQKLVRAVTLIASERVEAADLEVLLMSKTPGIRATGCVLAGRFAVKELGPRLRVLTATDPYILVASNRQNAVSFVAPVRERAAEALERFGETRLESAVRLAEGFEMLKELFAQKPELRSQIESLIESALRSDFHGEAFEKSLREFVALELPSAKPGEKKFLELCRQLSSKVSRAAKKESEWPRDSQGNPLPPPPTRP